MPALVFKGCTSVPDNMIILRSERTETKVRTDRRKERMTWHSPVSYSWVFLKDVGTDRRKERIMWGNPRYPSRVSGDDHLIRLMSLS